MKYYLSGKISNGGSEASTFDQFNEEETRLVAEGHEVFNPAKLEVEGGASWEWYLSRDLKYIYENRPTMFMLKGWEQSQGARLECEFAKLLGLTIEYK